MLITRIFRLTLSCFILFLLLSACASVGQFRNMSAQQRAQMVCGTDPKLKNYHQQYYQLQVAINSGRNVLTQGYRTHKSCSWVQVPSSTSSTMCRSTLFGVDCTTTSLPRADYQCSETPVAIDANLEQQKIHQFLTAQQNIQNVYRKQWNACVQKVQKMPIKQAYDLYVQQYFK